MLLLVALGMVGCASAPQPEVASKIEVSMVEPVIEPEASQTPDVNEILTVYKEWRGVPYRMGGSSQRGIDCSAFAREVFRNAVGIELPRDTRSQVHEGTRVSKRSHPPYGLRRSGSDASGWAGSAWDRSGSSFALRGGRQSCTAWCGHRADRGSVAPNPADRRRWSRAGSRSGCDWRVPPAHGSAWRSL